MPIVNILIRIRDLRNRFVVAFHLRIEDKLEELYTESSWLQKNSTVLMTAYSVSLQSEELQERPP